MDTVYGYGIWIRYMDTVYGYGIWIRYMDTVYMPRHCIERHCIHKMHYIKYVLLDFIYKLILKIQLTNKYITSI
jgi:hypothetical protein